MSQKKTGKPDKRRDSEKENSFFGVFFVGNRLYYADGITHPGEKRYNGFADGAEGPSDPDLTFYMIYRKERFMMYYHPHRHRMPPPPPPGGCLGPGCFGPGCFYPGCGCFTFSWTFLGLIGLAVVLLILIL